MRLYGRGLAVEAAVYRGEENAPLRAGQKGDLKEKGGNAESAKIRPGAI